MQYTVNKGEKGKIDLKVDVPKAAFEETYDMVVGQLGKDLKVDGFRPGQVPKAVIEQRLGLNKILNEAASFLVSKHLSEIFQKEQIVPVANPKIAVEALNPNSPFSFTATLFNKPKVKIGDWRKIKLAKVTAKEVTEADVNESIKNVHAAYLKSQNEKASKGESDSEEQKDKFIYDAQGNKIFLKDDEKDKAKAPHVKIDDEFAKKIGARDLAHLQELVKKDLETIVADNVEAKLEEEIFDEILKLGELEVPEIMVEDELNRILVRLNSQIEGQGKKLDEYLTEQKTTIDELKTKWRPQAEKNVKVTLLMDEIGREEKIQVARAEIDEALKGVNEKNLDPNQKGDLERYLLVSIFQAKTLALVKKTIASEPTLPKNTS